MVRSHDLSAGLALLTPASRRGPELGWLARSHAQPQDFFAAVHALLAEVASPGPKSSLDGGIDFYHDMVVRHLGGGRPALRVHVPRVARAQCWQLLSYDQLHARCTRRAAAWLGRGVGVGSKVCVLGPFAEDCVVSLLTALRLGAVPSLLEPEGPDYVLRRLAALGPDFIAGEAVYVASLVDAELPELLPCEDEAAAAGEPAFGSHSYAADEVCGLWFSPLRRQVEQPVSLTAAACYSGAARDGAVALALRPDDAVAAPGFAVLQHQPALLFAALVMGACFVHIDEAELVREPELLTTLPLRSVGVTARVREAVLDGGPGPRPRWDHWFKNPEEPCDWLAWRDFIEQLDLADTAASNLLFESAGGGCLLASVRRPGKQQLAHLLDVTAAAGRAWSLLDFNGSGQPTLAEVGVFASLDADAPVEPCHVVLGRRRGLEYLYGGTVEPRRCGRVYPEQEVLDAIGDCPFLHGASVVAVATGGAVLAYRFVLLGFTGLEPGAQFEALKQPRIDELRRVLVTRLSEDHLPDHIELLPYHARLRDGLVDHEWSRAQYLSGLLHRKLDAPVFQRLGELRRLVFATAL